MPTLGQFTIEEVEGMIDAAITDKTEAGSISNADDGALRKQLARDIFMKLQAIGSGGSGGASTILPFVKHSSVVSEDIGKLMMVDLQTLVENPSSLDDFALTARVSNTTAQVNGAKGVYRMQFSKDPMLEPKRQKDKLTLLYKPVEGDTLTPTSGSDSLPMIFSESAGDNVIPLQTSYNQLFGTILTKITTNQWGAITNADYALLTAHNYKGVRFEGAGLNDFSTDYAGAIGNGGYETFNKVTTEIISNGFVQLNSDSGNPTISFILGETITGDTSGATGILYFKYDAGTPSGSYLRVYGVSGIFLPTELVRGDLSSSYISAGTVSIETADVAKVIVEDGAYNVNLYFQDELNLNAINTVYGIYGHCVLASNTGHTIGDKWVLLNGIGGVAFGISGVTGVFEVGEIVTGATSGQQGIIGKVESDHIYLYDLDKYNTAFIPGETITGDTSGATASLITFNDEPYYGEPSFEVEWYIGAGNQESGSFFKTVQPLTTGSGFLQVDNIRAATSQEVYNQANYVLSQNPNNVIISATSWDHNNSQTGILFFGFFFSSTFGTFGTSTRFASMKFFATQEDWRDAINEGLENSENYNGSGFPAIFDLTNITNDVNYWYFNVTNKTVPVNNNNFNAQVQASNGYPLFSQMAINTITAPLRTIYESVRSLVLGVLTAINGGNCSIDASIIVTVKLSADGNFCAPSNPSNTSSPLLFAWRDGTVIDIFALQSIFEDNDFLHGSGFGGVMAQVDGIFSTYDLAIGGMNVRTKRLSLPVDVFGN